jgi:hypothetical protein
MIKTAFNARLKALVLGMVVVATVSPAETAGAASLFDGMTGTWSGRGKVTFEGGSSEDLSCRAYYSNSGSVLSLAIRCASTSYKTEIRSKLHLSGDALLGEWEERNFNAVGSASGFLSGNTIVLRISGAIDGRMTINQVDARQSVTISSSSGGLSSVHIGLSRT